MRLDRATDDSPIRLLGALAGIALCVLGFGLGADAFLGQHPKTPIVEFVTGVVLMIGAILIVAIAACWRRE